MAIIKNIAKEMLAAGEIAMGLGRAPGARC